MTSFFFVISIKNCTRMRFTAEISMLCCRLQAFKNSKMTAKLSGAQNVLSASVSARSCKNWARAGAQIFWLSASASAVKFIKRTKALLVVKVSSKGRFKQPSLDQLNYTSLKFEGFWKVYFLKKLANTPWCVCSGTRILVISQISGALNEKLFRY